MKSGYKQKLTEKVMNRGERDRDFEEYVQELIDNDRLDGSEVKGIAKRIVSHGFPNLSVLQQETFISYGLLPDNYLEECEMDYYPIKWSDMIFAVDSGLCDRCRHMKEKND